MEDGLKVSGSTTSLAHLSFGAPRPQRGSTLDTKVWAIGSFTYDGYASHTAVRMLWKKAILDWLIEIKPQEYLDEFLEKMYLLHYFIYLPSSILLWLLISLHFMSSADIWYAGSFFPPHPLWEGHCGSRSKDQATRPLSRLLLGSSTCPPASWETLKSLKSPGLALTSAPCGICWL